ncbi:hypothetical protein Pfo_018193 [Paulownia fortunei]|nr:hypothetical protein Pfo_018193 [Paulownia fortunei]
MGSFSGLGIGLSFVFGCILMGLVAELYYLLWWKKRMANTSSSSSQELTNSVRNPQEQQDLEMGSSKDLGLKGYCEEGVETEFLFTIKEESKEDLESDDGKSRKGSRTRSLSDLVLAVDGTPLSSPTVKTPHSLDSYNHHGINPLFESLSEAELNRLRSSPPPKFKFLKDAEDKLLRRLLEEEADRKKGLKNEGFVQDSVTKDSQNSKMASQEEKGASFVSFINKSIVREQLHNQASQVLPLASSPTFQPSA